MRPGRVLRRHTAPWLALVGAGLIAAACGSRASYDSIEGAGGSMNAPRGTVAIGVTLRDDDCGRPERECAELSAIEALLFTGVPGTSFPRPLVTNERQAREQHSEYFERLFEQGEHGRYVVRVAERGSDSFTVLVNHDALRRALVQEGVIRRFGR
jgi:hypothetical protein